MIWSHPVSTLPPQQTTDNAPAQVLEYAKPKVWSVGTLTYTTAGLVVLFCWLLWGDFAWSMKERSVSQVLQVLLKNFKASDTFAGVLMGSLPALIGLFLVPVISYRSDRHRGRWGRRLPYLFITTPIAALAMVGMAFGPKLGAWTHNALGPHSHGLNPSIVFYFSLFWTLFEFATIAANAVFNALINDVVPQAVIGRFFGLFRALSLIAGMIFFFWLMGIAGTQYIWIFAGIGALYAVGFTMMCLKVREGQYPPPPPVDEERGPTLRFFAAAMQYFRYCFSKPYYLWVFVALTVANLAFVPVNLFSVRYAINLEMDMGGWAVTGHGYLGLGYGGLIAISYFISLVLSYFLGVLADRFHPLRMGMFSLLIYAGAMLWGGLYARDTHIFAIAFVGHTVLSGTFFTTTASLGQRLYPRVTFAQIASAGGLVNSIANMVIGPAIGTLLDRSHIYRYTFLASCAIAIAGLLTLVVVHVYFMKLGGPKGYVPPE